jgi:peptide/nickel transport system substrate-binding protein
MKKQQRPAARPTRRLKRTIAVPVLGLAAFGLAACGSSGPSSKGGGVVQNMTWAIPGDIVSLDPAFNYDYNTATVDNQVCEALLKINDKGQLEPNLATSWNQPNATTYVFNLRKGVKFQDGTPMTPQDVVFSMERDQDPKLGSYLTQFGERLDKVEVTGPNQVTAHLKEPDATFKYAVANQSNDVISQKFVEKNANAKGAVGQPNTGIDCTGPYKVDSWTPGQDIKLSAFTHYWDGEPKVRNIDFKVVEDEQTQIAGLNSGEIDGSIQAISGQGAKSLDTSELNLLRGTSTNAAFIGFNTGKPPFNNVKLRQALSYALDKQGIVGSVYAGYARSSKSPAPSSLWTYSKPSWQAAYNKLPAYSLNLQKAKQLVKQAGAEGAQADLVYTGAVDQQTAVAVQAAANKIGLKITPKKLPSAQLTAQQFADGPKPYQATLYTWGSDFPDPIGNLNYPFNSALPVTNVVEYDNPQVDSLLDKARGTINDDQRASLLQQAQAIIVKEQPWAVYAWPDVLMPLNNKLTTNYKPNGYWYFQAWAAQISGAK